MMEIVSSVTRKGQVTIPAEIRRHLGLAAPDKVAFVLEPGGKVALHPVRFTSESVLGSVPALPGRETVDFDDQIAEAMEEEAARIVGATKR